MNNNDLISVAKGAGIAGIGAGLTFITQWASGVRLRRCWRHRGCRTQRGNQPFPQVGDTQQIVMT